jgi:cytochrome c oxidase accessory protein FixG
MCVDTCPTGIDIRNGLQLECIACTQCIDACDQVMTKLKKPTGLIRFSSQARIEGEPGRLIRPRVLIYPAVMLVLLTGFGLALAGKQSADITLLRGLGKPFLELTPGEVTNQIRVKIKNRSGRDAEYKIEIVGDIPATITTSENPISVEANQSRMEPVSIAVPQSVFEDGKYDITLRISDGADFSEEMTYRMLGPYKNSL